MEILIIGGVAAGTKTAAKLKREIPGAKVTILTKEENISYAACGLPYFIGGIIEEEAQLVVNTPKKFEALTGASVISGTEAVKLNYAEKTVEAKNTKTGEISVHSFDKLVIATGASPVVPSIDGVGLSGVHTLRTPADAVAIRNEVRSGSVKKAVVIGGGFIGLEVAENLRAAGVSVTVIEAENQLFKGIFDYEIAGYLKKQLIKSGIRIVNNEKAERINGDGSVSSVTTANGTYPCELVVLSAGVRPNTAFLAESGITMDNRGRILVDSKLRTNLADVYAAGDCVIVKNRITGGAQYSPMGSSANMEGRVLARAMTGADCEYPGVLGTGVVKLPGINAGRCGLTETGAVEAGYEVETALSIADDKPSYYTGASNFFTKLIADKKTGKLLGAQVLGSGNVDKMIDVAVTAISMGASLRDFDSLDLAYAPPFSTAIHPMVQAAFVLENKIDGKMKSITPGEYLSGKADGFTVLDVTAGFTIRGAVTMDFAALDKDIDKLNKNDTYLIVCNRGKKAYLMQNRLAALGFTNTYVLEGGITFNDVRVKCAASVSPEEIKRVKGLGFLHDKNTADCFNGRVITRNGKITAEESRAISEAAERFGSGEIAMTSRLTIEIQGIPFDNIEPLREFLNNAGLETGGTGSKVRPVVSCKGTTCQYGLIDTFALSEEIHERFYEGYHDVLLPHKFKIAVGGCPNNCVKPDLNDLGIIGQRVPVVDLDKCRGCKVCQVEKACPIHVAKVEDGKLVIDPGTCNHCGRCVGKCPFHAVSGETNGYRVFIGGRWGKRVAQGRPLSRVFTDREEVLSVVEKAILLFREQGIAGERFADTIARIGFENVEEQLLSDGLLERKNENLSAVKHTKGGATC